MKKDVKEKESKRIFKCLERDEFSRRDMQQIVHLGRGGESSNCPSTTMTSKKMVLGGILAFFMSMLLVFSVGLLTGNLFDRSGKEEQSIALTEGDWWINDGVRGTGFDGGDGSPEHPYEIQTAEQLAYLSYMVYTGSAPVTSTYYYYSGVYFKQTADIDLSAHYWQPIGTYYNRSGSTLRHYFAGNYDGGGYTVLGINTPSGTTNAFSYQGLFGYVRGYGSTTQAEIKNVGVIDSNIQGNSNVGGIAGYAYSNTIITNCYNTGSVFGSKNYVGGIAGYVYSNSTITNCYNTGSVSGSNDVAGIVGWPNSSVTITNCYNTGAVTGSSYVGGIVGTNNSPRNCYNTGIVTGSENYVGGIIAYGSPINCYNTGAVTLNSTGTGACNVGGISGLGNPTNCFNLGEVIGTGSGTINIDGITANGTATNCYYGGDCTLEGYSNSLVNDAKNEDWLFQNLYWDFAFTWKIDNAENKGYPILRTRDDQNWWLADSSCYTTTWKGKGTEEEPFEISTAKELAGLSYLVYSGTAKEEHINGNYYFSGVYFKQTADINLSAHYWQPIGIYYDRNGTQTQHYFSGIYDGGGYTISGLNTPSGSTNAYSYQGLFGYVYGESPTNQAEIKNVGVINSNIQGYNYVGGIVGDGYYYLTITNCYNTASVTGSSSYVGGIVGQGGRYLTITNCYNTGIVTLNSTVSATSYVGGIVGISSNSTITNCYNTGIVTLTSTSTSYVGGITGTGLATNCYNTGLVTLNSTGTRTNYVGGITGTGLATNCYNTGTVTLNSTGTGTSYVGGISGRANPTNCFNLGEVIGTGSGTINISGIAADGTATNSYYGGDCTLSGYTEGLTENVQSQNWCEEVLKWDFVFHWKFDKTQSDYPILKTSDEINWWLAKSTYYDTVWEGSGTKEDPYLISNAQELAGLSYMVYSGKAPNTNTYYYYSGVYFKQTADIDLSEHYWQPIGIYYDRNGTSTRHYFSGNYDGGGYTVSGINTPSVSTNAFSYQGLFGYVSGASSTNNRSEIKNVGVINSNIHGYDFVGGIVGCVGSYSNIMNCYNTGDVTGSSYYAGGIVGYLQTNSPITCCYNTGSVTLNSIETGTKYVGGISSCSYSTITNSFNLGKVTGTGSGTINIDGITANGTATNCYYGGDCTLEGYSNSLVNDAKNEDWLFQNLYWDFAFTWKIDNAENKGYPILRTRDDQNWWLADSSCYTTTWKGKGTEEEPFEISTAKELAGLSYLVYSGTAKEEHINGNYYFSGVYFKQTADINLSAHYWQPIGICYGRNGTQTQHYFSGIYDGGGYTISGVKTPYGETNAYSYQGLFGYVYGQSSTNKAEIKNVGVIDSYIFGYQNVGGIAAFANANATINFCYNRGDVYGVASTITGSYVGGILGQGSASYCYNTGKITFVPNTKYRIYAGGITGNGSVSFCFNLGAVNKVGSGTSYSAGPLRAMGVITKSYFGGECTMSGDGFSETLDADVKNLFWLEEFLTWDVDIVWTIKTDKNDGYPILINEQSDRNWWLAKSEYYTVDWVGSGTENDPYLISSPQDLAKLSYLLYSKTADESCVDGKYYFSGVYFKQTKNIDLSEHVWEPIGNSSAYFSGIYDGNNFAISGIKGSSSFVSFALFGYVVGSESSQAKILNLKLIDSNIKAATLGSGLFVYGENILISNCESSVIITLSNSGGALLIPGVGSGLGISILNGVVENCKSSATIDIGLLSFGAGITAFSSNTEFISCVNYSNFPVYYAAGISLGPLASVVTDLINVGEGLVRDGVDLNLYNVESRFNDCVNYGTIGQGYYTAGISLFSAEFYNCVNYGDVISASTAAGIVISNVNMLGKEEDIYYDVKIQNCFNFGTINGVQAAGIVYNLYILEQNCIFDACTNYGSILNSSSSNSNISGVIGILAVASDFLITNIYNYGDVTGNSQNNAGIVANLQGEAVVKLENCINEGIISGVKLTGGLIGSTTGNNLKLKLSNCINVEDVFGTGDYIGGIIGSNTGQIEMNNVYSFGNVSGSNYVGGLIGNSTATNISIASSLFEGEINSTSTGTVYVGGFIGYGNGCSNFSVTGSYVNSKISVSVSSAYVGGIIGNITMSTTTDSLVIDKCAVVTDITSSTGEELTNSRAFYFSSNLVDTETILNSYAIFNDSLTLSDTTDGMDGNFAYLENFNGGKPVPIGIYYILDYGITTGIVDQINSLQI